MNNTIIKKLNEDDILEILIEYFQDNELKNYILARTKLFGVPGRDLRFVGAFAKDDSDEIINCNLEDIDKSTEYNGDHSFINDNPIFNLNKSNKSK